MLANRHRGGLFIRETMISWTGRALGKPTRNPRTTVHRNLLKDCANVFEILGQVVLL